MQKKERKEGLRHPRKVPLHQLSSPAKGESSRAGTANVYEKRPFGNFDHRPESIEFVLMNAQDSGEILSAQKISPVEFDYLRRLHCIH